MSDASYQEEDDGGGGGLGSLFDSQAKRFSMTFNFPNIVLKQRQKQSMEKEHRDISKFESTSSSLQQHKGNVLGNSIAAKPGGDFDSPVDAHEDGLVEDGPSIISISLFTIGLDPGHLQSGHYLWPAASFAATYLHMYWSDLNQVVMSNRNLCSKSNAFTNSRMNSSDEVTNIDITDSDCSSSHHISNSGGCVIGRVLELGSGCGLAGLLASRQDGVREAFLTDYDNGCLDLLRLNVKNNFSASSESATSTPFPPGATPAVAPAATSAAVSRVEFLRWGSNLPADWGKFDLIVGSDLLYCVGVVKPLLDTVVYFLERGGLFVLISSFEVTEDIGDEMQSSCKRLGLRIDVLSELDDVTGQCRVQYIQKEGL